MARSRFELEVYRMATATTTTTAYYGNIRVRERMRERLEIGAYKGRKEGTGSEREGAEKEKEGVGDEVEALI